MTTSGIAEKDAVAEVQHDAGDCDVGRRTGDTVAVHRAGCFGNVAFYWLFLNI